MCWIRLEEAFMCEVGENCLKYLKRRWNRKEGEWKQLKKRGQAGLRCGCLKNGAGNPLRTM